MALSHYNPNVALDPASLIRKGASVDVYLPATTTRPPIFTTSAGTLAKANPFTTDATTGGFDFWAAAGDYDVVIAGTTSRISLPGDNVLDVKRDFGAKGDGTTNDQPAFQACADAILALGRGTMKIPAGVYIMGVANTTIASVLLASNTTVAGAGPDATIIKRASTATAGGNAGLFANKGGGSLAGGNGAGNTNIHVRDLTIDGFKEATSTYANNQFGVYFQYLTKFSLANVVFKDSKTNGLVLEFCKGGKVRGCRAEGNLKVGLYGSGTDRVSWVDNEGSGNGSSGIGSTIQLSACWYNVVTGNVGKADAGPSLLLSRDTQYATVTGNQFDGIGSLPEAAGVPAGADLAYQSEHPRHNAAGFYTGTPTLYYGFSNSVISGNTIYQGGNVPGIDLYFADDNEVCGNVLSYVGHEGIRLLGSSRNDIHHNKIRDPGALVAGVAYGVLIEDWAAAAPVQASPADDNKVEHNHISGIGYGIGYLNNGVSMVGNRCGPNFINVTTGAAFTPPTGKFVAQQSRTIASGTATLAAGTVTVTVSTAVATSATAVIRIDHATDGGTVGWVRVSARNNAAGTFTITSSSATDTSTVAWKLEEPL